MLGVVFLLVGGGVLLAGLARRDQVSGAQPPAGVVAPHPTTPAAAPQNAPPAAVATRPPIGPAEPKKNGAKLDTAASLAAVGGVVGSVVGRLAEHGEVQDAMPTVGAGLGLAAYLANVGGVAAMSTTGALGVLFLPLVLVTFAVTIVADRILGAVKAGQWKAMLREVVAMKAAGRHQDALGLWTRVEAEVPAQDRSWGDVGEWPGGMGPWFGYTIYGPPPGATAADVAAHPETVPATLPTKDGRSIDIRALLDAAYADLAEARAHALGTSLVGVVIAGGKERETTSGDRDVRGRDPTSDARQRTADQWARALAGGVPWLASDALVRDVRTPAETAVDGHRWAAAVAASIAIAKAKQPHQQAQQDTHSKTGSGNANNNVRGSKGANT